MVTRTEVKAFLEQAFPGPGTLMELSDIPSEVDAPPGAFLLNFMAPIPGIDASGVLYMPLTLAMFATKERRQSVVDMLQQRLIALTQPEEEHP